MHICQCFLKLLGAVLLNCSTVSCIYEYDNCPPVLDVAIVNNWDRAPAANPEGMAYIFFPDNVQEVWRFDFPGVTAGSVRLNVGNYRFLSFNDDTYNVQFRGEDSYENYEAYTDEAHLVEWTGDGWRVVDEPNRRSGSGERVVRSPDAMWGCAYGEFRLCYDGVSYITSSNVGSGSEQIFSPERILTSYQKPLTARYSCRIEDVENAEGVRQLSAALSGLAGSMHLSTGVKGDYPVTLPFKARVIENCMIRGEFFTFGLPPEPDKGNTMYLFVVLKDGRKFSYEFDVTEQVREAADPMNVEIIVRGLKLEKSGPEDEGGFDVNVDGWQTITININS